MGNIIGNQTTDSKPVEMAELTNNADRTESSQGSQSSQLNDDFLEELLKTAEESHNATPATPASTTESNAAQESSESQFVEEEKTAEENVAEPVVDSELNEIGKFVNEINDYVVGAINNVINIPEVSQVLDMFASILSSNAEGTENVEGALGAGEGSVGAGEGSVEAVDPERTVGSHRIYGWIRDPNPPPVMDIRGLYKLTGPLKGSADLRKLFGSVYDQGRLGSCTANAISGAYHYYLNFRGAKVVIDPSRLFIYFNERVLEGTVNQDSGATLTDGMKTLRSKGACPESMWPYVIADFAKKPPMTAFRNARKFRCADFAPVSVSSMSFKTALDNGHPVVFGFNVYESFESEELATSGFMRIPKDTEKLLGGHAVVACGYDDKKEANGVTGYMLIRNSWGPDWGLSGYFWMPYKFIDNGKDCADCWVLGVESSVGNTFGIVDAKGFKEFEELDSDGNDSEEESEEEQKESEEESGSDSSITDVD
jgi:hypothetical protein